MKSNSICVGPYKINLDGTATTYDLLKPEKSNNCYYEFSIEQFSSLVLEATELGQIASVNVWGLQTISPGEALGIHVSKADVLFESINCTNGVSTLVKFIPEGNIFLNYTKSVASMRSASGMSIRVNFFDSNGLPTDFSSVMPEGVPEEDRDLFTGKLSKVRLDLQRDSDATIAKSLASDAADLFGKVSKCLCLSQYEAEEGFKFNLATLAFQPGVIAEKRVVVVDGIVTISPLDKSISPAIYEKFFTDIISRDIKGAEAIVTALPCANETKLIGLKVSVSACSVSFDPDVANKNREAVSKFIAEAFSSCFETPAPAGVTHYVAPIITNNNRSNKVYAVIVGIGLKHMSALIDYLNKDTVFSKLESGFNSTTLTGTDSWMLKIQLKNQIE